MKLDFANDWNELLSSEFSKPYFLKLAEFVDSEYATKTIYPPREAIFRAFEKCSFDNLKVVIIGQDPYHGHSQANGLCFSVSNQVAIPPSLRNIFKEVSSDIGIPVASSGDLERWAEQGVLMLNSVLTVREHEPLSHAAMGWETFTQSVIDLIAQKKSGVVYMAWGSSAQKRCGRVDQSNNCLLKSVHPSPLSAYRGFLGCRHFSQSNDYLTKVGKSPIVW